MAEYCKTCGKPPVAAKAGSVTSYFFQHNYCQCHVAASREKIEKQKLCEHCGKALPENKQAGSFTAFLFKELRCQCTLASGNRSGATRRPSIVGSGHTTTAARVQQRKQFTAHARSTHLAGAMVSNRGQTVFAPGTVIGGTFTIDSMVGEGGMGVVYLAQHNSLNRPFALKVLSANLVNEQTWQRFRAEALTIANLNHSTFVKVYDLGIHNQSVPYYSMDYLNGRNLEEILIDDGPMPLTRALEVFIEVLDGLAYAHRNGIIHRDLKPGNIMLCSAGNTASGDSQVKILDFGISKLTVQSGADMQSLTAAGEIFGSPFYMSPEQCEGSHVDARSDIYSIGCTLYEVLCGYVPFEGDSLVETMMLQQEGVAPSICLSMPHLQLPPAVDIVLSKCLAKSPADRYASARELALDLERILEGKDVDVALPVSSSLLSQKDLPERSVSSRSLVFAGCAALLLCGGLAFLALRKVSISPQAGGAPLTLKETPAVAETAASFNNLSDAFVTSTKPLSTKPSSTKPSSTSSPATEGADISSFDGTNFNEIDNFIGNTDAESVFPSKQEIPTGSEKETGFFSSIEKETDGSLWKVFRFPKDIFIGTLAQYDESANQAARGVLRRRAQEKLIFCPMTTLGTYPQYFKRFRPDDVAAVKIYSVAEADKVLAATALMPGLKELRLAGCKTFTPAAIGGLTRFKHLENLNLSGSTLSGAALARAECWDTVKILGLNDIPALSPLLAKLATKRIETLSLGGAILTDRDVTAILQMKYLRELDLRGAKIAPRQLQRLRQRAGLNLAL